MPALTFVLARSQNFFFHEIAQALVHEARALGVRADMSLDGFPAADKDTVYVLLPPHEYFVLEGRRMAPPKGVLARTIFISAEQPETSHFGQNVKLAAFAGGVFDINRRSVAAYARAGVEAEHLALGYTPAWDRGEQDAPRPADILFLGSHSDRRARYLASYTDELRSRRCRYVISDNSRPNPGASSSFLAGQTKTQALEGAKVLLNIHAGSEPYFEWLRVLEAIHAGCAVVSEVSTDFEPLRTGDHILFARPEALASVAQELLDDEERRERQGKDALEFIRAELPLRESVERLVATAEDVARTKRGLSTAVAAPPDSDGFQISPPRMPTGATQDPDSSMLRRAVKDLTLDVMDLRRQGRRLMLTQARGAAPPAVVRETDTPGYRSVDRVRVSVITALYNHEDHVIEALDSVARSEFRDFEVVVVDDGSSDGSRRAVRRWLRRHPRIRGLLLHHPVNRGLPAARNTAVDFARGDCLLVLDADNAILPNCMGRLLESLDADPGAAFAYGLLQRFDETGPVGTMSHFGWEPDRLRQANYIEALALLRTAKVRELGGYTTDRRLYGWEDYDLWCGLAEREERAVHVPEIVARYRASTTSMISFTNLSTTTAYAALIDRHRKLFAGLQPPL